MLRCCRQQRGDANMEGSRGIRAKDDHKATNPTKPLGTGRDPSINSPWRRRSAAARRDALRGRAEETLLGWRAAAGGG